MVDVFGSASRHQGKQGRLGPVGPTGPPGKNATDVSLWCPSGVLEMFRRDEQCTFYFNTKTDGILYDKQKPIGLKDRYGNNNAICQQNFYKVIKVDDVYGIELKNSLYKISDVRTATAPPSICVIALEFKVSKELTESSYLICNENLNRGVKISKESLDILGTDSLKLAYDYREWNTLIIQYCCLKNAESICYFDLNDRQGSFIPHKNIKDCWSFFIGGHPDEEEHFAPVVITNLEVYYNSDPLPDPCTLPKGLLKALKKDLNEKTN